MKTLLLVVMLLLGAGRACVAQQTAPATIYATQPASDSVRQAVHKLFRFGRLASVVGGVCGAMVIGSSVRHAAKGDADWGTGLDLVLGTGSLAFGIQSAVRFSRRRERQILAALEQGQPMPDYVTQLLPLVKK